ncbi:MAG: PQQ-binding-like beta-propeller repeat protein, partial [Planctomycetota bacterium]|nr:PQQ-binding-like beta-propeller repeat protein [Planctomycetota bacterium]
MKIRGYLFCAGLCLLVGSSIVADDWPQFRGPNSDGQAKGSATPLEWSDTKNVAWKVKVPGLGWSSPSVVGEQVFLTTAVPKGDGLSLRCLSFNAATGQEIWNQEVFSLDSTPRIHKKNSHASPTPLVKAGSVYVHFGTHGMAKLSAKDGAIDWKCTELQY